MVGLFTLLIIGSGYAERGENSDDSALEIAVGFGMESAAGDTAEWVDAAKSNPLWIIRVNSR